jgi:putative hemolysin
VGVVHLRELFAQAQTEGSVTVAELTRPVLAVAEVVTVPALWRRLREEGQHCAIVVNEYGSVVGMVTLEDAFEEIFGELRDEFDREEEPIEVVDGRVNVHGEVLLDVLRERFDVDLGRAEVDTVGGLVWHELGRRPAVGDEVSVGADQIVVRVDRLDGNAVGRASFDLPEVTP